MNLPDPSPVTDLSDAFRRSKTVFTAVSLGVFDTLAEGPSDPATLAHRLKPNPGALERLLGACAGLGFLLKKDGKYASRPVAEVYLTSNSPNTLTGYIEYSDTVLSAVAAPGRRRARGDAAVAADVRCRRSHLLSFLPYRNSDAHVPARHARIRSAEFAQGS